MAGGIILSGIIVPLLQTEDEIVVVEIDRLTYISAIATGDIDPLGIGRIARVPYKDG